MFLHFKGVIKIRKTIFILIMIVSLFMPVIYVNAGAPKLIYETAEGTTKALIKAVEARKGFKVIDGTTDTVKSSEVFTQAIAKEMQEVAQDSWQVINGGALDSTPLKGLPGWSKVVIGTASFISGADIAIDIWNQIQKDEDIDFISNLPLGNIKQFGNIFSSIEYSSTTKKYYYGWFSYDIGSSISGLPLRKVSAFETTASIVSSFEVYVKDKGTYYDYCVRLGSPVNDWGCSQVLKTDNDPFKDKGCNRQVVLNSFC
ncbi:hypothetical protein P9265_00815 [Schinkia azotoformans]|uniref:hypothetical protein n=1 Tax=Schinkia azotoformans TaxID=1454 RepID=UPI002E1A3489|nr:hypothetical protein [Schinkia azotoformans]